MRVDGLSHCAQDAQAAAVVLGDPVVTKLHQAADEGGSSVQHTHLQTRQEAAACSSTQDS
jgi:hypothetical protein